MRLYSSPLPLRTTAEWSGFRNAEPIPHRFGETAGRLLQYSSDRRTFVWADHACQSIDRVFVDEVEVFNWTWRNGVDSDGRTVCFVEFSEAPDDSSDVRARGRGKLSTVTGNLIESPADVIYDILANIAGKAVTRADLDPFRRECERAGLTVAGSLDDETLSVQGAVRQVCDSVGAVFAPDAIGLAFLHPGGEAALARETVDTRFTFSATAALDDLCNDLTLRFDFSDNDAQQAVRMECPASVAAYGRRPRTLDARWLNSARVATVVAERLLQRSARPVWAASAEGLRRRLRIGEGIALDHGRLPIEGTFRVLSRALDLETGDCSITFEVPAGPAPSVVLVNQSARLGRQESARLGVSLEGDEYEFELVEENGKPLAQAAVTLNDTTTRQADGAGIVRFPRALLRSGTNRLVATTLDGRSLTIEVPIP